MNRSEIKIIISYENPPIPHRSRDWCAYEDGREEDGNYGWGRTPQEALSDFLDGWEDEEE